MTFIIFFFSSRRRHTRCGRDWSSDVCSSDLRRRHGRTRWRMGSAPLNPRHVLTLAVAGALSLGVLAPIGAYWWGYDAGQRAADQEAVIRGIVQAVRIAPRVAALADTVATL